MIISKYLPPVGWGVNEAEDAARHEQSKLELERLNAIPEYRKHLSVDLHRKLTHFTP
jgi:hypothetical protein